MKEIKTTVKRPEIYKPFGFLIVIFGLLELSGFAVLANYSIIMIQVRTLNMKYELKTLATMLKFNNFQIQFQF